MNPTETELDPDKSREFLMTEYVALRSEIDIHVSSRKQIDAQVLTGIFAIYAWVLTRPDGANADLLKMALALPAVLCLLGFLKWVSVVVRTMTLGNYIREAEEALAGSPKGGWEHYLFGYRSRKPFFGQLEGWTEFMFWVLAFAGSIGASVAAYVQL